MEVRTPRLSAAIAAASLIAYAPLSLVNVVAGVRMFPAPPGGERWPDHATTLGWVNALLGLFCYVAVCVWFYRATGVARSMSPAMKFTPKWAVLWLLIPIANLLMPLLVLGDLLDASSNEGDDDKPMQRLIMIWAAAWIAMPIMAYGGRSRPTIEANAGGAIISWGCAIVAALAMAAIVMRLTAKLAHKAGTKSVNNT